jgi:hypothetical protein
MDVWQIGREDNLLAVGGGDAIGDVQEAVQPLIAAGAGFHHHPFEWAMIGFPVNPPRFRARHVSQPRADLVAKQRE